MAGGTKSGTPLETRDLAGNAGAALGTLFSNPTSRDRGWLGQIQGTTPISYEDLFARLGDISGRMSSNATQNILGFGGADVGAAAAATRALEAPQFDLSQMYAALMPFERQQDERQVAGLRGNFGSAGGRFSRNATEGEAFLRGELSNQHNLTRQNLAQSSFQDAEGRRIQALSAILPHLLNAQNISGSQLNDLLRTILGFGQAGAPVQDPGILPGLLGAATQIGGVGLLPGGFLNG